MEKLNLIDIIYTCIFIFKIMIFLYILILETPYMHTSKEK